MKAILTALLLCCGLAAQPIAQIIPSRCNDLFASVWVNSGPGFDYTLMSQPFPRYYYMGDIVQFALIGFDSRPVPPACRGLIDLVEVDPIVVWWNSSISGNYITPQTAIGPTIPFNLRGSFIIQPFWMYRWPPRTQFREIGQAIRVRMF